MLKRDRLFSSPAQRRLTQASISRTTIMHSITEISRYEDKKLTPEEQAMLDELNDGKGQVLDDKVRLVSQTPLTRHSV